MFHHQPIINRCWFFKDILEPNLVYNTRKQCRQMRAYWMPAYCILKDNQNENIKEDNAEYII